MHIILAKPRGFCAGVERAIHSVERALELFGEPVYVLNHIVHNTHVVESLKRQGAIFVRNIEEVPENAILLFSAHGVGPEQWEKAKEKKLNIIDATCPLVQRVHHLAKKYAEQGYTILLIGDAGHDETIGTMGWAKRNVFLVQNIHDAETIDIPETQHIAYITQTTLSVEDCKKIVDILYRRFPHLQSPSRGNICYATTNRQKAVLSLSEKADIVIVVGDSESANSRRLAEIAKSAGKIAYLVLDASEIHSEWLNGVKTILITSGASVPEKHVQGVIQFLSSIETCSIEEICVALENVHFELPKEVRDTH
ncbi:MAG: 4-hydroxy-3-methylbut-2-enyl diphosphate reductase [Candidatus Hydrogenedens sp.]